MRGTRLPERLPAEFWTNAGRISFRPVPGAKELAADGFVLPGLVDLHTNPGAPVPGEPLDDEVLSRQAGCRRRPVLPAAAADEPGAGDVFDGAQLPAERGGVVPPLGGGSLDGPRPHVVPTGIVPADGALTRAQGRRGTRPPGARW